MRNRLDVLIVFVAGGVTFGLLETMSWTLGTETFVALAIVSAALTLRGLRRRA